MQHWWSCIITSCVRNSQAKEWELLSSYLLDLSKTIHSPQTCSFTLFWLIQQHPTSVQFWDPVASLSWAATCNPSPHPVSFPRLPPSWPPVQATTSSCLALDCTSLPWSPKVSSPSICYQCDQVLPCLHLPPTPNSSWKTFERHSALRKKKKKRLNSLWWPIRGCPYILVSPSQSHFMPSIQTQLLIAPPLLSRFRQQPIYMVSLATSLHGVWLLPASPASCQSTVSTLTAGLHSLNFYLLNIYQTPSLFRELNTEQKTKDTGPWLCWKALPQPWLQPPPPGHPLGLHSGLAQGLFLMETWGLQNRHPTFYLANSIMCLCLKQRFKTPIFPASVSLIWLPDSSERWWGLQLFSLLIEALMFSNAWPIEGVQECTAGRKKGGMECTPLLHARPALLPGSQCDPQGT